MNVLVVNTVGVELNSELNGGFIVEFGRAARKLAPARVESIDKKCLFEALDGLNG